MRNLPLLLILAVALSLRLDHNLRVHPPEDFIWSDMKGYFDRAKSAVSDPMKKSPWAAFFPFGTHFIVAALFRVFGDEKGVIGAAFAVIGTGIVAGVYGVSRELWLVVRRPVAGASPSKVPALTAALIAAVYYPHISFGGYVLSEVPFSFFLTLVAYFGLRLARTGSAGSAYGLGLAVAAGIATRSQLLLSLAALVTFWFVARRRGADVGRVRLGHWARALVPVAFVLIFSAVRVHYHVDRWALVSTNGPLNYVFGRCHCQTVSSKAGREKAMFGPPPFHFLNELEKADPDGFARLSPVLEKEMKIEGRMWDAEKFNEVARRCVEKSGIATQARFAALHVAMLWAWNGTWPDSAVPSTRARMRSWSNTAPFFLIPATIAAVALAFRRRTARFGFVAMHLLAMCGIAALYFGDTRLRVPYDGLMISAGVCVLLELARRLALRAWALLS